MQRQGLYEAPSVVRRAGFETPLPGHGEISHSPLLCVPYHRNSQLSNIQASWLSTRSPLNLKGSYMRRLFVVTLVFISGLVLGLYLRTGQPTASARVGHGGGVEKCSAKNGDVNADGNVDLSDAVTTLNYLFLGNPSQLVPLCSGPAVTEVRSDTILGVLLILLDLVDGLDELGVAPSCGSLPTLCCPGGNPLPQCGPLRFELVESPSVFASPDPTRFPFTLRIHLQTVSDIPVNIPLIGDCSITVDTTPGIPFIELHGEMVFRSPTPDDGRPVVFSSFSMSNLEEADVALSGGFSCAAAASFTAVVIGSLRDLIVDRVADHFQERSLSGLCQPLAGCQRS